MTKRLTAFTKPVRSCAGLRNRRGLKAKLHKKNVQNPIITHRAARKNPQPGKMVTISIPVPIDSNIRPVTFLKGLGFFIALTRIYSFI